MSRDLEQIRRRAAADTALHGCSSDPCGSLACETARDRDALLTQVDALQAAQREGAVQMFAAGMVLGDLVKLHRPVKRWQTHEADEGSFDTEADVRAAYLDENDEEFEGEVPFFEICAECGRIEAGQMAEIGAEVWNYREGLWPCRTAKTWGAGSDATPTTT